MAGTSVHPIWAELRATFSLAAPLAAAGLAQMVLAVTDTVMVGRLGPVPLAAVGLGATFYFTTAAALQAIISAVAPLGAHALGRGDGEQAGQVTRDGLLVALMLMAPFLVVQLLFDRLLLALGYEPELAAEVAHFLYAIAWGTPAILAVAAVRSLLSAASHTRPIIAVSLLCIPVNAALNWVLIYGNLGAPALGVAGSGYASATVQWLTLLSLMAYVARVPALRALKVFRRLRRPDWSGIVAILRLGAPIGGMTALEYGVFLASSMVIGLFGTSALGANQIVLNCAAFTFMVPLGLSQAATVRVAFELGAANPEAARRAGFVALGMGIAFMSAAAMILWTVPHLIIGAYVNTADPANREVVEIGLRLMLVAALFQIFDGTQTVAAGALRGYKDVAVPMLYAGIGYWALGFVGGWLLAFPAGLGPVGLWWGLALGLAVVAVLLTGRLVWYSAPTPASSS